MYKELSVMYPFIYGTKFPQILGDICTGRVFEYLSLSNVLPYLHKATSTKSYVSRARLTHLISWNNVYENF